MKKRIYKLRQGDVIEVEELHDGKHGAPGMPRQKKKKPTKEDIRRVNAWNKAKRCKHRMIEYFDAGDLFATLTYNVGSRPKDMKQALDDFSKLNRYLGRQYKKRKRTLYWIRNIEQGTKGAWHIHLVIKDIGDTAALLKKGWTKGGVWVAEIRNNKFYDEDFQQLANYMTKDEHTVEERKDGTKGKPRLRNASYGTSRNMPLPEPREKKIKTMEKNPQPYKGYYIVRSYEGINPVTGFKYRRYTMIRYHRRD